MRALNEADKAFAVGVARWSITFIGLILTVWAVGEEQARRGYYAVGGEWLIFPAMLIANALILKAMEGHR